MRLSTTIGLFIFGLTFVAGVLSVSEFRKQYLSDPEMLAIASSIDQVELPKSEIEWRTDDAILKTWPFEIKYKCSSLPNGDRSIDLNLMNVGNQTVYFHGDQAIKNRVPIWLNDASHPDQEGLVLVSIPSSLAVGDSTNFSFLMAGGNTREELTIRFSPERPQRPISSVLPEVHVIIDAPRGCGSQIRD